jgi:hypothetical protein
MKSRLGKRRRWREEPTPSPRCGERAGRGAALYRRRRARARPTAPSASTAADELPPPTSQPELLDARLEPPPAVRSGVPVAAPPVAPAAPALPVLPVPVGPPTVGGTDGVGVIVVPGAPGVVVVGSTWPEASTVFVSKRPPGGTQSFTAGVVGAGGGATAVEVLFVASGGAAPMPVDGGGAAPLVPELVPTAGLGVASQVQVAGQSREAAQTMTFGWQLPGKDVVVVHMDGGGTATSAAGAAAPLDEPLAPPEPPEVAVPGVATPLLPEHAPMTVGMQLKRSPQSVSVLQGSCHLYTHVLTTVVVQTVGSTLGAGQSVFGAQGPTLAPPLQAA